jgi:hypothetical protein
MARHSNLTALKLFSIYRRRIESGIEGPRLTPPLEAAAPSAVEIIEPAAPPVRAAQPPEPIKENVVMSQTKTVLTDELVKETYDELYIGQSTSTNRCAEILDVHPADLKAHWKGMGFRLRDRHESRRARDQQGEPWLEWETAEPEPNGETPLAHDLGLAVPDTGSAAYANGSLQPAGEPEEDPTAVLEAIAATDQAMAKLAAKTVPAAKPAEKPKRPRPAKKGEGDKDPGPGRRAVPVKNDALNTMPPLKDGETVAFKIKEGTVYDVQHRPSITATGLAAFANALDYYTLKCVLNDIKAEADPEVNHIRYYLAAEYKKMTRGGK